MKIKQFAIASALAVASVGSYADVVWSANAGESFTTLSAFDTTTLYKGVAAGTWEAIFNFTGNITLTSVTLNGVALDPVAGPPKAFYKTGLFSGGDITLEVKGFTGPAPKSGVGSYSGVVSVSAIPEPETYALLLAGLGVVGFVAKRRVG
jgi:hypothetical protein